MGFLREELLIVKKTDLYPFFFNPIILGGEK